MTFHRTRDELHKQFAVQKLYTVRGCVKYTVRRQKQV